MHLFGKRRRSLAIIAILGVLALSACGSRRSHAALENALRGSAVVSATQAPGTITAPSTVATTGGGGGATATGGAGSTGGATAAGSGSPTVGATTGGSTTGPTTGSTSTTTGGSATATNSLVPGVEKCAAQKAPVIIGSVGEQSGLAGAAVAGGASTVAAWAGYVNSLGGLRCHPIKFIKADDGAEPSENAALTQQLVEQDHVAAFVYNNAPLAATGGENYLISHHIPVVGSEGADDFYNDYPNFFPQMSSGKWAIYASYAGLPSQLTPSQRSHVALIYCIEASACSIFGSAQGKADIANEGMHLVYSASASLTAPSFTSQCLGAKRAGATFLIIVLDPNSIHRAAANCRAAGYAGKLGTVASVVIPDDTSDTNLNGVIFDSIVEPWTTTGNPQITLMNQVIRQYAPGLSPIGTPVQGWTSAQIFAYSSTFWPDKETITSADITTALDKVRNYDVGGLTGSISYYPGKPAPPVVCWYNMGMDNGKFYTPNNGKRFCKEP
ncbi:MAG TPA: ABC transporter substrate-binding protein [Mycobacteriales bacterium]|jgi:branched-chain amino acid transport system substrate-binding protein|nr:ABC transporter substrate-binding protein [Mycobacteriales bacterium]